MKQDILAEFNSLKSNIDKFLAKIVSLHFVEFKILYFFAWICDFFHLHSTNLNFCNLANLRVTKLSGTYFNFEIWQILKICNTTISKHHPIHGGFIIPGPITSLSFFRKDDCRKAEKLKFVHILVKIPKVSTLTTAVFGLYLSKNIFKNDPKITDCCTHVWSYSWNLDPVKLTLENF